MDVTNKHTGDSEREVSINREQIRHSASHIMADAITQIFPDAKLGIGPPTEDGFYYDIDMSHPITPEDLAEITQIMQETIDQSLPFNKENLNYKEASEIFSDQPYKLELIEGLAEDQTISIYRHGTFTDLCQGPHVTSTKDVPAFKLLSVAGAYWKGDETRPMLQRVYGTAFESQQILEEHLKNLAEAEKRDHRKLGKLLNIFTTHEDIGPGLILWQPNGSILRTTIEDYWREQHLKHGYDLIYSPHIGRSKLWDTSGHLDFYSENMYSPINVEDQEYYLKPMNCPFHIMAYKSSLRSYRELPIRYAELGTVYRYERSGVIHGAMRVRGFTQDDAHIFCSSDQLENEISSVLELTFQMMEAFNFEEYGLSLSTQPNKFVGNTADWDHATESLKHALESRKLKYELDEGGGAFYGPKIDVTIKDALNRSWQCTTIQVDFNLPERFDLSFQGSDGTEHQPYMVHRAILGSMERFIGILIEHYGGAFPLWLAPIQAVIIPIADRHIPFSQETLKSLSKSRLRVKVDARNERMNQKIRDAQIQKIPYMLVIGDEEVSQGAAAVRSRDGENMGPIPIAKIISMLENELRN